MYHQTLQRIEILLAQGNHIELERLCRSTLDEFSGSPELLYYLTVSLLYQEKTYEADEVCDALLTEHPEDLNHIRLKANIQLVQKKFDEAEDKLKHLLKLDATDTHSLMMLAQIKGDQRNYDKAIYYLKTVLEIDPENIDALNAHSIYNRLIGNKEEANISATEALRLNPESASSIANHGLDLLRNGKIKESLERFQEALQLNPNNSMAQYGMKEALKSKFWPYRMMNKLGFWMSRFGGDKMWTMVIGSYIVYRAILGLANSNESLRPFLMPIVYLIMSFFILTWIFNPLMNLYLFTNKYGKYLLEPEEKESSRFVGVSLLCAVLLFIALWITGFEVLLIGGIFFVGFMIPLGSMNNPNGKANKKKAKMLSFSIIGVGLLGMLLFLMNGSTFLLIICGLGLFAYQWILNYLVIKESGRRFGD